MRQLNTYFDQIPVAQVKEIAEPLPDTINDESENDGVSVPRPPNGGTPARDGWRTMAQQIQKETDTTKLIELVQQLIARFDEQEQRTTVVRAEKSLTGTEKTPTSSAG
jgi:hypothetical protein